MLSNVGSADKLVRIVIGIVLALLGLTLADSSVVKALLFIAAAIALLTSVTSFCPLYKVLGISTGKK